jgi:mannose-6-phosphate isomerase-like protein (cupin superfamily)
VTRGRPAAPPVVHPAEHRGAFFRVLQTTARTQTAVMTLAPGQDGGPEEEHPGDQVLYVVEGEADLRIGAERHRVGPGALVVVPAGTRHHVANPGPAPLFLVTVYAPPAY